MKSDSKQSLLNLRLAELRNKSFDELKQLPSYNGERTRQNGKLLIVSVWKDMINAEEVQVVVQIYHQMWFGLGRMIANGFRAKRDGAIRNLSKQDLYDFV